MNVLRITFLTALVLECRHSFYCCGCRGNRFTPALRAYRISAGFLYPPHCPDFYLPMRTLSLRYHDGMTGVTAAERSINARHTGKEIDLPASKHNLATLWREIISSR